MRSPEYDNENNEIIIGGSGDDSDYDDYSRRLERRQRGGASRSGGKKPQIEYDDEPDIPREQSRGEKKSARVEQPEPAPEKTAKKPKERKAPVIERIEEPAPRIKRIEREQRRPEPVEERPAPVQRKPEPMPEKPAPVQKRPEPTVVKPAAEKIMEKLPKKPEPVADEIFDDVMSTAAAAVYTEEERVEEIIPDAAVSEKTEPVVDEINDFIDSTGDYFGDAAEEEYDEEYVEQYVESFSDGDDEPSDDEDEYISDEEDDEAYDEAYDEEYDDDAEPEEDDYDEPSEQPVEEIDYYYVEEDEGFDENGLPIPVVKPRDIEAVRRAKAERKAAEGNVVHNFLVSASPHIHCGETTKIIMGDVIVALIPALIASTLWFGWRSLMLTAVCVLSCVLTEYICRRVMKRRQTIGDLSAAVTGMILAFCLPPEINPLFAVVGSVVAIAVVKQMFGGIGMNFANPAATARIVLMLSFPVAMTTWSRPFFYTLDAVTEATPLAKLAEGADKLPTRMELFVGYHGGCLGETCAVALLLGGIYLLLRRVITWEIPVCFMGTVMLFSLIVGQDPIYQVLSGGVVLGAIFMATDYVTSPVNSKGKIIYGIGCGLLTMLIRLYGNMPEGVSFAILLMNIITPHIDNLTLSKPFGEERDAA